jgi:hypothetical protein
MLDKKLKIINVTICLIVFIKEISNICVSLSCDVTDTEINLTYTKTE